MTARHVLVRCDVYCDWQDQPPSYRLWVGDELFAERTYIWQEQFLEEAIPVYAEPGDYEIRYELVPPSTGTITVKNIRIDPVCENAKIKNNTLKIYSHEST